MGGRLFWTLHLVCILVTLRGTSAIFDLPSPWGYKCDSSSGLCIKEEKDGISSLATLARCKLTCNTDGVLWPKPTSATLSDDIVEFLPANVTYNLSATSEEVEYLLKEAISIFKDNLQMNHPQYSDGMAPWDGDHDPATVAHILKLDITVSDADTRLTLDTDESYELSLSTTGTETTAVIISRTFFGARHALETVSQLAEYEENTNALVLVGTADISDSPVFPYRGILLDTSRNFYSVRAIKRTLDGLAANKLNTFHWHITDSHSFPMHLENMPFMTYYGAYTSRQIYYPADIKNIVEYGRVRGIRVLPEFDAPAHVGNGFQWGPHHGLGNLAVCINKEPWFDYCVEPPCGQLNLANPKMYDVLSQIYEGFIDLFSPIDLFHYGGDEVNLNCWNTTDEIVDWMLEIGHDLSHDSYHKEWSVFQTEARKRLIEANDNQVVPGILWTSSLTEKDHVDKYLSNTEYIIQIWTEDNDPLIGELLDKKFKLIFSNYDYWYLDCGFAGWVAAGNNWCSPYKGWQAVYDNNPMKIAANLTTSFDPSLILGGEAALWSEQVDDAALDSRLWPRGAALGERLWSNPDHDWKAAEIRMVHQRQRMVQRGIQADRLQPQWCHQNEGLCYS